MVFLEGVGAHTGVGAGKGAVLEGGIGEEVGGRHRYHQAGSVQRPLELPNDTVTLTCRGALGYQVVVVQVDTVGAQLSEFPDGVGGLEGRAGRLAEGVASGIADRPETEGELVALVRGEGHRQLLNEMMPGKATSVTGRHRYLRPETIELYRQYTALSARPRAFPGA
jgi:hypothetical protein